jgi:ATP/ADP translocase
MHLRAASLLLFFVILPSVARACTVCFGAPGSAETEAAGWAIGFLLLIIVAVLGCVAAFGIYLYRRSLNPKLDQRELSEAFKI